ncbi:MAG: NAD-dependent deacylase [Planctomycetes bacterium]|nr:NAD-dependent deacylase [Planctomycetota bacterium]
MNDQEQAISKAAGVVRSARRLAALTGAGISAESGLQTFRGAGGLWEGHRVEEVATPHAFRRDPAFVWRFYNLRRANLAKVAPNPGHQALVHLEERWGADAFTLVTQNVDGLHFAAGSQNVLEIHGTLRRVRCSGCDRTEDRGVEALPDLPRCEACGELLRPDVVWFQESLPPGIWERAERAVSEADCLLVVGTSAVVYPAAGLIDVARWHGATVVEVNSEPTGAAVDVVLRGPAGRLLPELVRRL